MEDGQRLGAGAGRLGGRLPDVGRHRTTRVGGCRSLALVDDFAQAPLAGSAVNQALLALLTEHLALHPVELALQIGRLPRHLLHRVHHLLRREPGRFYERRYGRGTGLRPAATVPQAAVQADFTAASAAGVRSAAVGDAGPRIERH